MTWIMHSIDCGKCHMIVMEREDRLRRWREQYSRWFNIWHIHILYITLACTELLHLLPIKCSITLATVYVYTYYTNLHLYQQWGRRPTCSLSHKLINNISTNCVAFLKRLFTLKGYSYLSIALQVYSAVSGLPQDTASIYLIYISVKYSSSSWASL